MEFSYTTYPTKTQFINFFARMAAWPVNGMEQETRSRLHSSVLGYATLFTTPLSGYTRAKEHEIKMARQVFFEKRRKYLRLEIEVPFPFEKHLAFKPQITRQRSRPVR